MYFLKQIRYHEIILKYKKLKKEIKTDNEFDLICEYINLRNNSNISQRELAKKVGVAQSTIARMEKNLHSISWGLFTKILSALNCELKNRKIKR